MKKIRNIPITDQQDYHLQRGESCLKYWIVLFLATVWITRDELPEVEIAYHPVKEAAYHPVRNHTTLGSDTSLVNLISDWLP